MQLTCKVAIDAPVSVLKSHIASPKAATKKNITSEISVKLTPRQAKAKRCLPTRAPAYNWMTGTFEEINYQTITYYYYRREASCCNRYEFYFYSTKFLQNCRIAFMFFHICRSSALIQKVSTGTGFDSRPLQTKTLKFLVSVLPACLTLSIV